MDPIGITGPAFETLRSTGQSLEQRIQVIQNMGPQTDEEQALMDASKEFESFFLYMLLKEMRKTVMETPLFHGGQAEKIFRDMMDEEMAKEMVKTPGQGLGIADVLYQQLSRPLIAGRLESEDAEAAAQQAAEPDTDNAVE